jgi:signal transduction histidine kinase
MSPRPARATQPVPASAAHELRSALNGIKSWAHVLENELGDGNAMVRRALAGIMTGVEQQVRIIEDLEEARAAAPPAKREG